VVPALRCSPTMGFSYERAAQASHRRRNPRALLGKCWPARELPRSTVRPNNRVQRTRYVGRPAGSLLREPLTRWVRRPHSANISTKDR
jgi:hypothetical protein